MGLANGKSEAWYILRAAPGAKVAIGLAEKLTQEGLREAISDGSIADVIAWRAVSPGDVIIVPAGTIHAIGAGLVLAEIRQDYARMRLAYRPEFLQPAGVWHGGVIATMIDTVVVPAVGGGYDEPRQMFTIDIALRYLASIGPGEDAIAEGWVVKRGRQIVYCDAEVYGGSGALAATGALVYKVSSRPLALP
jgi:uncharacterized protein (TIGR00369 family)